MRDLFVLLLVLPFLFACNKPPLAAEPVRAACTPQEVPYADTIRNYTKPGESFTLLELKDSAPPKKVSNSW